MILAKDPEVKGSRSDQSSATPLFKGTKAPNTLVSLCFGAIREGPSTVRTNPNLLCANLWSFFFLLNIRKNAKKTLDGR